MKKYISYIGLILIGMLQFSCQKESFNYKPGYVGISKITNYAVFTLTGGTYYAVPKGSTYTEPGVSAKAGTATVTVKTSGTVNTAVAGVYVLTYSAVNPDGFTATANRYVCVYSTDASAVNNDFSGDYVRTNGQISTWTKVGPGVYTVFNPGGASGTNLTVVVFNDKDSHVFIPQQNASDGSITSSKSESSTPGAGGTLAGYQWVIINSLYGTGLRIFTKQ